MVFCFEVKLCVSAYFFNDLEVLFAACRHFADYNVLDLPHQLVHANFCGVGNLLGRLDLVRQHLTGGNKRWAIFFRCAAHEFGGSVLFGAKGLKFLQQLAPGGIGLGCFIDDCFVVAASALRSLDGFGVLAKKIWVDHGLSLPEWFLETDEVRLYDCSRLLDVVSAFSNTQGEVHSFVSSHIQLVLV